MDQSSIYSVKNPGRLAKSINLGTSKLLKKIIDKGGLLGACAEIYLNDDEKSSLFILECSEHCHSPSMLKHWGNELVDEITDYSLAIMKLHRGA